MELIVEIFKLMMLRSDPALVICVFLLGSGEFMIWRNLRKHTDPKNKSPHPGCEVGEKSYQELCQQLNEQHQENREDMQALSSRIDMALAMAARKRGSNE